MKGLIIGLVVLVGAGLMFIIFSGSDSSTPSTSSGSVTIGQINSDVAAGAAFIDVRTPEEYAAGYIEGATNLPLQDIQSGTMPDVAKDKAVYVYCRSGNRSAQAATALRSAGYTNVIDLGAIEDVQAIGGKITTSQPQDSAQADLLYLIEEEKLAYDVYNYMYDRYGAKVFNNIAKSEATHQERVLSLLQAAEIADPRTSEPGVFVNVELQQLYNQLISQGDNSLQDAYEVGVAIEERDIADITKQLESDSDIEENVASTLQALRSASQNHLKAFSAKDI